MMTQNLDTFDHDVVAERCGYEAWSSVGCTSASEYARDVKPEGEGAADESWYIVKVAEGFDAPGKWATWSDESGQFQWHETEEKARAYWDSAICSTENAPSPTKEAAISCEKAVAILNSVQRLDSFVFGQDYWLCEDEDGNEYLIGYGEDEPVAENDGRMSWTSPGYPDWVGDEYCAVEDRAGGELSVRFFTTGQKRTFRIVEEIEDESGSYIVADEAGKRYEFHDYEDHGEIYEE